ncbi:MAG: hypothetical protein MOGMAGMI_02482 [Candidatus Omnitrophica bacterium]|nr:hypothetical protein [Candidatus Omnitrophota bacterium]
MQEEIVELRQVVYEVKGERNLIRALRGITKSGNEVEAELGRVGRQAGRTERALAAMGRTGVRELGNLVRSGKQAAKYLAAAGAASAALFVKSAVGIASQRDATRKGFTAMLKDEKEAMRVLERIRKVSLKPGVTRDAGESLALSLIAVRINADTAVDAIEQFGNALALAGRGEVELERVGVALSQIVSKGKISAEEINQLAESVPQIRDVMQRVFGTADTEKLQKDLDAAGISAQQFIGLLVKGFGELERANPNTLSNSLTNMKAAAKDLAGSFGAAFATPKGIASIQAVTAALEAAAPAFRTLGEEVASWLPGIANWIQKTFTAEAIDRFMASLSGFGASVKAWFASADSQVTAFGDKFSAYLEAIPDIGAAAFADLREAASREIDTLVDDTLAKIQPLLDALGRIPGMGTGSGVGTPRMAHGVPLSTGGGASEAFTDPGKSVGKAVGKAGQMVGGIWDFAKKQGRDAVDAYNDVAKAAGDASDEVRKSGKSAQEAGSSAREQAYNTNRTAEALDRLNQKLREADEAHRSRMFLYSMEARLDDLRTRAKKNAAQASGEEAKATDAAAAAQRKQNAAHAEYLRLLEQQRRVNDQLLAQAKAQAKADAVAGIRRDDSLMGQGRAAGVAQARSAAGVAMARAQARQRGLPPSANADDARRQLRELFLAELAKIEPDVKATQARIREATAQADRLKQLADDPKYAAVSERLKQAAEQQTEFARREQLRLDGMTAGFDDYSRAVSDGMQRNMDVTQQWLDYTAERLQQMKADFGRTTDEMVGSIIEALSKRGKAQRDLQAFEAAGAGKTIGANMQRAIIEEADKVLARYGVTGAGGVYRTPGPLGDAVNRVRGDNNRTPRVITVQMQGGQPPTERAGMNDRLTAAALGNFGMGTDALLADARLQAQGRIVGDAMTAAMMPMVRIVVDAVRQMGSRVTREVRTQLQAVEGAV